LGPKWLLFASLLLLFMLQKFSLYENLVCSLVAALTKPAFTAFYASNIQLFVEQIPRTGCNTPIKQINK
jgi:hypothetical protein